MAMTTNRSTTNVAFVNLVLVSDIKCPVWGAVQAMSMPNRELKCCGCNTINTIIIRLNVVNVSKSMRVRILSL